MPQNNDLNAQWRQGLGENWAGIQEKCLHTFGNLTLTGSNSEYSDHSFAEKRDMAGGFKDSPLKLNNGLGSEEFLKLYVAFKAETNFVDVVPQAKGLRMILNLD